jgi:hypothetical protein
MSHPAVIASVYQPKNGTGLVRVLVARLTGNRAQASGH